MQTGLIGLPGSGKSTIFAALTGRAIPDAGAKTPLAVVHVPDERVDALSKIFAPKKTTYAEIIVSDVLHGRTQGSFEPKKGELFSAAALGEIRPLDALACVLGGFDEYAAARTLDAPQPHADLEALETELIFADLLVLEKRKERKDKEGKRGDQEYGLIEKCLAHLEADAPMRTLELNEQEKHLLLPFALLSRKPAIAVVNISDDVAGSAEALPDDLRRLAESHGMRALAVAGKLESEIAQMGETDRAAFNAEMGLAASARDRFIQTMYANMDLISFFTVGDDEVRAWTIHRGDTALTAAGKIHSDIARGFIRAEVTPYDDFIEHGSEQAVKAAGKMRLEGKEYIAHDGDIMHFRFNV